ncbi:hypothetical protein [Limosilactobacillus sp.]|uniref:hypothetical protein n=1 Tax=Limosilactobacillus sp. TaxID=2773925 RepID=UPI0035A09254
MDERQKRQFRRAMILIRQQKWQAASNILGNLLAITNTPVIVKKQVLVLVHLHQYIQAQNLVFDQPTLFLGTQVDAKLALQVLLANQHFIKARLFITGAPQTWQTELKQLITDSEQAAELKYQATIKQTLQQFYHLGDGNIRQQRERLDNAYNLPLNDFLLGTRFVLRDPFVQPLIKSDILEKLRAIGVATSVTYLWLDNHEYQVIPAQLKASDDLPIVHAVRRTLRKRLANQDIMRYQLASQQFNLQIMFLFPRITTVITDPQRWVAVLLATINGQKIPTTDQAVKWQQLITTRINELAQGNK